MAKEYVVSESCCIRVGCKCVEQLDKVCGVLCSIISNRIYNTTKRYDEDVDSNATELCKCKV